MNKIKIAVVHSASNALFQIHLIMSIMCSLKQTLCCQLYVQKSFMYKQSWLNPVTKEDAGCGSQCCCREAATCIHTVVHAHHSGSHNRDWTSHPLTLPHATVSYCSASLFLCGGSCTVARVVFVVSCFNKFGGFAPAMYCVLTGCCINCFMG